MLSTTPSTLVSKVAAVTFGGLSVARAGLALGAGIVDRDIETAEARNGLIDQAAHLVLMAYVGMHELGFRAKVTQLGNQRLAGVVAAAGDDDAGAFASESEGSGPADAGKGAGD